MDFDFTTETITPDSTSILTIGGNGALELPVGTTGQQPGSAIAGAMRFNTNGGIGNGYVEYYDQSPGWKQFPTVVSSVASFQTSLSGLTPSTATTGAVTLAGTLGFASGGTGLTSTPANGQIDIGNGAGFTRTTLTAGTAISVVNASGAITINNTGVTSNVAGTGISVSGATGAVTITNTGVTSAIGTAGNITVSAATGAVTFNLGAVTQSTGSNLVKITLDSFGRVVGNTAVSQSDLTTILGTAYLSTTGGTMSGAINMGTNQINNLGMSVTPVGTDAVNVNYVQAQLSGLSWKQAVKATTTGILTATYANGVSGVGATLTATTNVVLPAIDTISLVASDRVLVKNQGNTYENGIYVVTSLGSAGVSPWVLTRATDSDTAAEVDGSAVYVQQGATLTDTGWTETATMTAIGAGNPIIWAQFSGSGAYAAGTGLLLTGNTFSNTGVLSFQTSLSGLTPSTSTTGAVTLAGTLGFASGGTGLTSTPANGQLNIGNGAGFTRATLTAGTAISVVNTSGAITINNTGVTSFQTSLSGLTPSTSTTGAVTLAGTLGVANGGTALTATPTNGQLLIGNGTNYSLATLAISGTSLYVANGAGTITLSGPKYWSETSTAPTVAPSAVGTASIATGTASLTRVYGQVANASGNFAAAGDAQNSTYMLRAATPATTGTVVAFLDGSVARLVLPINSAFMFDADIVCRSTTGVSVYGAWNIKGLITREAAAAVAIQGSTATTRIASVGSGLNTNSVTATADSANSALQFNVIGTTAATLRWVITVRTTEVTN
jgi:hypothetical protein